MSTIRFLIVALLLGVATAFQAPVAGVAQSKLAMSKVTMGEGGKGFGGGEATRDHEPTYVDPNDTKGKQRVLPDMLIVDESSYFKTWSSKRNKGLRKVLPRFKARLLLTATPRSSSVLNLFPQAYLTDGGETLGKRVGAFKSKFGYQGGFKGYEWIPFPDTDDKVNELMEPISIRLDTQDYANMPELFITSQTCQMPAKAKREYDRLS